MAYVSVSNFREEFPFNERFYENGPLDACRKTGLESFDQLFGLVSLICIPNISHPSRV
jgi:hypothetical protein